MPTPLTIEQIRQHPVISQLYHGNRTEIFKPLLGEVADFQYVFQSELQSLPHNWRVVTLDEVPRTGDLLVFRGGYHCLHNGWCSEGRGRSWGPNGYRNGEETLHSIARRCDHLTHMFILRALPTHTTIPEGYNIYTDSDTELCHGDFVILSDPFVSPVSGINLAVGTTGAVLPNTGTEHLRWRTLGDMRRRSGGGPYVGIARHPWMEGRRIWEHSTLPVSMQWMAQQGSDLNLDLCPGRPSGSTRVFDPHLERPRVQLPKSIHSIPLPLP